MAGFAITQLNRRKYKCYFTEGLLMVSTQDPLLPLELFCLLQVTRRMFWVSLSIYAQIRGGTRNPKEKKKNGQSYLCTKN